MYATLADMLVRFDEVDLVQLTDQANAGVIDEARVASALDRAANEIRGYVAVKYQTRDQPVPPLLTDIACTLAHYGLHRAGRPDDVASARKDAIASLEKIAKGTIKLDAGEEALPARSGAILVDRRDRLFGRDSMAGF